MKRPQLYQCLNAKTDGEIIYCSEGHPIKDKGDIFYYSDLQEGRALYSKTCIDCTDLIYMGTEIRKEERGWK